MRPLHVCFVSHEYPPETGWGGIGSYTYEMAHGLVRAGHRVTVISSAERREQVLDDGGVTVHRVLAAPDLASARGLWRLQGVWPGFAWSAMRRFREIQARSKIDLIEAPEGRADGVFIAQLRRRPPLVVRLHTAWIFVDRLNDVHPDRKKKLVYALEKRTIRRADALTAPSNAMVRLTSTWVKDDSQAFVVPNPVDTNAFKAGGRRSPDEILFAGRLEQRKGLPALVAAVPQVLQSCPNASFRFVGADGTDGAGDSWRARLLRDVSPSSRSRIHFEQVGRQEMVAVYQRAGVCVLPSSWENFPYVLLEAMSCETPVVATAVGGLPEMIDDGKTGLLVSPNQPGALTEALCAMVGDQVRSQQMGKRARIKVIEAFSTERIVPKMVETYNAVLKAKGSVPHR
jgi:glycosyltransferase involved in cell wall biosynthesis